jgi:hypothetical protein
MCRVEPNRDQRFEWTGLDLLKRLTSPILTELPTSVSAGPRPPRRTRSGGSLRSYAEAESHASE